MIIILSIAIIVLAVVGIIGQTKISELKAENIGLIQEKILLRLQKTELKLQLIWIESQILDDRKAVKTIAKKHGSGSHEHSQMISLEKVLRYFEPGGTND